MRIVRDIRRAHISCVAWLTAIGWTLALVASLSLATHAVADSGASFGGSSFGESDAPPAQNEAPGALVDDSPGSAEVLRDNNVSPGVDSTSTGRPPVYAADSDKSSGCGAFPLVIFLGVIALLVVLAKLKGGSKSSVNRSHAGGTTEGPAFDVMRLELGINGALRELRQRLESLATSSDMSTHQGRQAVISSLCIDLQRHLEEIQFASVRVDENLGEQIAEQTYLQLASGARAKFSRETLRADASGVHESKRDVVLENELMDEDGDFLVREVFVLTLVIAADNRANFPRTILDADALRAALTTLSSLPAEWLTGMEIVWSPSAESDAMTIEEMQTSYPELMRL